MQFNSNANADSIQLSAKPWLRRRWRLLAIAAGVVTIAGLSFSGTLRASNEQELQTSDGNKGCTTATLHGRYLFAESGLVLPPAFGVAAPTWAADAGIHILNGDGSGTDTVTLRIGGKTVLENAVSPTQYTVNPDCTGTLTLLVPNGPKFDIFIAPDGSQFASISTGPDGNYPASIARRVSDK